MDQTARRFPVPLTLVAFAATVFLVGLGNWQWHRLAEKEAFLTRLHEEADAIPATLTDEPSDLARVTVSGDYLNMVAPVQTTLDEGQPGKSLGGLGFWWMTPLKTDDGRIIYVNRGFVPAMANNRPPALSIPQGRQTIIGIVRAPEKGNPFLPTDIPAKREFFRRDAALLIAGTGSALEPAGSVAPFTIDAERSGSAVAAPVGLVTQELIDRVPNNHLSYAFTWWGLAVTLICVYFAYLRSRSRASSG